MTDKHLRVRILITNKNNEILLVRSWFGHQKWSLPGGGIKRKEAPLQAVIRETYEETGMQLRARDITELGSFKNPHNAAPFSIACFAATVKNQAASVDGARQLEVLDIGWFPKNALPADCSPVVRKALSLRATR